MPTSPVPTSRVPTSPATTPTIDPSAMFRLDDRVAILTGASSGLGERFARVLHAAGAKVIAAARRVDRLDDLAGDLDGVVPVGCDITRAEDVARLVEGTMEAGGRIDILVNNAGISTQAPAEEEPIEQWLEVMDTNLNGLFMLTQAVARHMIEQGSGTVVNIASMLGLVASAPVKQASYCATKGAVVNLTRELAVQWARKGLRVNAIAPGWFPSEMTRDKMFGDPDSMAFLRANTPMARGGNEHELDGVLLFLASEASSYVTGQTIVVDGGWTAR